MILQRWLEQLCCMIPGVKSAIVIDSLEFSSDRSPAAIWPDRSPDQTRLLSAIPLLKAQASPVVTIQKSESSTQTNVLLVAYPLELGGQRLGAVILEVTAKSSQQPVLMQMLAWGERWLELLLTCSKDDCSKDSQHVVDDVTTHDSAGGTSATLQVVSAVLASTTFQQALMTVVTEIARYWSLERVSIGIVDKGTVAIKALSYSAEFDRRSNLAREIQQAMQEVVHQRQVIVFPGLEDAQPGCNVAHETLMKSSLHQAVFSVPLFDGETLIAVLTCEGATPESAGRYQQIESLMSMLGPLLSYQAQAELSMPALIKRRLYAATRFSISDLNFVSVSLSLVITTLFLSMVIKGDFRVAAPAMLEGRVQRAVVAPYDGYIAQAYARAGEEVSEGDSIAELEDSQLQLERQRWSSQKEEYSKQYRKELAALNHSKARIVKAQIAQADAQVKLIEGKIRRSQLLSPLDGIIVEGDLSRSLGAPVEQGQILFEIAPLNEYRVVLKVDEQDISHIEPGQQGVLTLTAYPSLRIPFQVDRVAVVFQQDEERIWFRTEAIVQQHHTQLRPGMQGVGKVTIGEKNIGWIWFHRLADWFRLKLWAWLP